MKRALPITKRKVKVFLKIEEIMEKKRGLSANQNAAHQEHSSQATIGVNYQLKSEINFIYIRPGLFGSILYTI